jgi:hypothetical protein
MPDKELWDSFQEYQELVTCARNIAEAFNKYLATDPPAKGGVKPVDVPEELERSPYQEGGDEDEADDE